MARGRKRRRSYIKGTPELVPTKRYSRRKGRNGFHQGCFGPPGRGIPRNGQ